MKNLINFTKYRYFTFALPIIVIVAGITGVVLRGGFNLSIDFESGLNQRISIAPIAFSLTYDGEGDASVDVRNSILTVEVRNEDGVEIFDFPFSEYPACRSLEGVISTISGITIEMNEAGLSALSSNIITGLQFPAVLSAEETIINYTNDNQNSFYSIDEVRAALAGLDSPQIQTIGNQYKQEFMIRASDPEGTAKEQIERDIYSMMETAFGKDTIVIEQSDYVGPRFSSDLASQSIFYVLLAFVLIAVYIWVRFKLAYAFSAIAALIHDVLIMVGFIGVFQLEVSTTTIAAVLTIIGYSLNDTIVVFDRIRENEGLMQDSGIVSIINTSITQSLSRTIITSLTTLIAVTALYIFGSGPIKDFALNLIVGIFVGTYSSIFVASPVFLGIVQLGKRGKDVKKGESKKIESPKETSDSDEKLRLVSKEIKHEEIPKLERKLKGKRKKKR